MDFALNEQQALLRDSAYAFLNERFPLEALQALAIGGPVPDLWEEFGELGWCGLLVPETHGGSGGDLMDAVLVLEALGYAGVPSPYAQSAVVGAGLIHALGTSEQQAEWLPVIAKGELIVTPALAEGTGEFSPESVKAAGAPGEPLSGTKLFVKDADRAGLLLTALRWRGEPCLVAVPSQRVSVTPMDTLSGEPLFAVDLTEAVAEQALWLGEGREGAAGVRKAVALGALARAAELVGLGQRVLDICVEHISIREQSGRPIGAFQALQHSAADMLRNVEGARGIMWRAAWSMANNQPAAVDVAMAKAYASDACFDVVRRGHQLMGAIGYCEEHPMHILHKRIQAAALDYGDAAWHLDQVADALGLVAAA